MYNKNKTNTMNKDFLKMQKLAGIITEGQFKEKVNEAETNLLTADGLRTFLHTVRNLTNDGNKKKELLDMLKTALDSIANINEISGPWSTNKNSGDDIHNNNADEDYDGDEYPRLDQETYMDFLNECFECFDNGANAYDDNTWTDDEKDLAQNLANVIGRAGIDIA
jgi:hypothetical protein